MRARSRHAFNRYHHPLSFSSYLKLYHMASVDISQVLLCDLAYGAGGGALYSVGLLHVLAFKPTTAKHWQAVRAWWQYRDRSQP